MEEKHRLEIEKIKKFPDRPVTQIAYARYAGVTAQTVGNWVREGKISLTKSRKVIPSVADKSRGGSLEMDGESDQARYLKARADKEEQNAKLARQKFEEESGQLVDKDDVNEWAQNTVRAARKSFENMPRKLAHRLASMTDAHEINTVLAKEIREILAELARGLDV